MAATSPVTENKALVQRLFDGLDEQDSSIMDELIAEDFTTEITRSRSTDDLGGRDGMKSLWEEYWTAFPDLRTEALELIAEGNRVAYFKTDRGTHDGVFRGVEPTGTDITFEYAGYFDIEDGQIVHSDALGSMLSLFNQLGVDLELPK